MRVAPPPRRRAATGTAPAAPRRRPACLLADARSRARPGRGQAWKRFRRPRQDVARARPPDRDGDRQLLTQRLPQQVAQLLRRPRCAREAAAHMGIGGRRSPVTNISRSRPRIGKATGVACPNVRVATIQTSKTTPTKTSAPAQCARFRPPISPARVEPARTVDARQPRAPRPHLLALFDERHARARARALFPGRALARADRAPAETAHIRSARVRDGPASRARALAHSAWAARRPPGTRGWLPADRGSPLPAGRRPASWAHRAYTSRSRWRASTRRSRRGSGGVFTA